MRYSSTADVRSFDSARLRAPLLLAIALLCAVAFGACSHSPPLGGPGYVQVDITTSPVSIDPRYATDVASQRIGELVFDSMVKIDRHGQFYGDLAESYERPSATVLVFHLRHDAHFSNGQALTARDVVYTYNSVLDPKSLSLKSAGLDQLASIRALDPYTVEMTTKRAYAAALEMAMLGIVPYGTPLPGQGPPTTPLGTGAFMPTRFVRDEVVVLARSPARPAPPNGVQGIIFKVVPDATVRPLELTEGICDLAENDSIEPTLIPYLAGQAHLRVIMSPGNTYQYLAFNFRDQRLRDIRVRRAIAHAIDRKAVAESMRRDTAQIASGMLPPGNWAYHSDVTRYSYDPQKSMKLLEEAGYSPLAHPLKLVYKTTPEGKSLAEVLQEELGEVGIAVQVRTNEWATFYGDLERGNFDIASSQWVGVTPHLYNMVFDSHMIPPIGDNRGAYANPRMDKLLQAAGITLDTALRKKIYAQVQSLAAADLPYVSLWWPGNIVVINRRLHGFEPYPNGSLISLATATFAPGTAHIGRRD
ncbi:MAG: ABC transporter substrate-binding protein [Candidatus Binataceae bacterium]